MIFVAWLAVAKQVVKKFCGGWCHHTSTPFAFKEIIDFADSKLLFANCWRSIALGKIIKVSIILGKTCMTNNQNYKILLWFKCTVRCKFHYCNTLTDTDLKNIFNGNLPLHNLLQCKWFSSEFIKNFWFNLFSLSLFLELELLNLLAFLLSLAKEKKKNVCRFHLLVLSSFSMFIVMFGTSSILSRTYAVLLRCKVLSSW